ncbi:hypothetical protein HYALB_00011454 [Hymenoscyphus albidus]|uniref:Uncharacterized protein n=1 Tax=Hymenoscyphus albidus TaxID=595503 RepID=A0A9N9LWF0_9HELO|nr:hypothetical protein HYALB_00011454 [Hymenoscyphus albidus]
MRDDSTSTSTSTSTRKKRQPSQSLHSGTTYHTPSNLPLGFSSQSLQERSIRPSMARYLRPVTRNEEDEDEEVDLGDTSEGLGSALRRMRRERRGMERVRYEDEDEKEDFQEEEVPTQPQTPRLTHLHLVLPTDSNFSPITTISTLNISVSRPKYSSAFEGRRLASSARANKREPLKVVTPPSRNNAQLAKELVKSQREFKSYLQSLRKRVEVLERCERGDRGGEVKTMEMEIKNTNTPTP